MIRNWKTLGSISAVAAIAVLLEPRLVCGFENRGQDYFAELAYEAFGHHHYESIQSFRSVGFDQTFKQSKRGGSPRFTILIPIKGEPGRFKAQQFYLRVTRCGNINKIDTITRHRYAKITNGSIVPVLEE